MDNLTGSCNTKKKDSSPEVINTNSSSIRSEISLFHAGMLRSLVCSGQQSCCEPMATMAMSIQETASHGTPTDPPDLMLFCHLYVVL